MLDKNRPFETIDLLNTQELNKRYFPNNLCKPYLSNERLNCILGELFEVARMYTEEHGVDYYVNIKGMRDDIPLCDWLYNDIKYYFDIDFKELKGLTFKNSVLRNKRISRVFRETIFNHNILRRWIEI